MRKFLTRDRLTTAVGTLVALAVVGTAVVARQSLPRWTGELDRLYSALTYQIESSYRHNVPQRDARMETVRQAVAAWQGADQNPADREAMTAWLRESIARSMPGSTEALPSIPEFPIVVVSDPQVAEPTESVAAEVAVKAEKPSPDIDVATKSVPRETPVKERAIVHQKPVALPDAKPTSEPLPSGPIVAAASKPMRQLPKVASTHPVEKVADREEAVAEVVEQSVVAERTFRDDQASERFADAGRAAASPGVGVNLTELTIRIAVYHDLLDSLEEELERIDEWDTTSASRCVDRIERASREHAFVTLYYGVLSPEERSRVISPREPEPVTDRLRAEVDRWLTRRDRDFLRPLDTSRGSLGKGPEASTQLAR